MDMELEVKDLSIGIRSGAKVYTAVNKISFSLRQGEILGLVGESGCGKSITVLSLMGLLGNGVEVTGGSAMFEGKDLLHLSEKDREFLNGNELSMIYQEPMTSLNPLHKIGKQVGEPLRLHTDKSAEEIREEVLKVLSDVGLPNPEKIYDSYPHQLSGGMRQRVMIAMAAITSPRILIADEPTTALDVTTQAEILDLLRRLNEKRRTTILFISHDLGIINRICSRVIVMYAGQLAESGLKRDILDAPKHPYTIGLMNSIPTMDQKGHDLRCISGRVPSVTDEKNPCPFAPRCFKVQDICCNEVPPHITLGNEHYVNCHFPEK